MKKDKFIDWNERMFVKYNNVRLYKHPNPIIRYTENKRVNLILNELRGSNKVVDVGCGEGYILKRIEAPTLVGVDISENALRSASTESHATLVRANAESLPFCDSYFDSAVCSETLEHTVNPKKVVQELRRIVRPGGTILLSVPNEPLINNIKDLVWNLGLFNLLFPNVPRRQNDEWHIHSFDLKLLKSITTGVVKIEKIRPIPFGFLPIRYLAICRNEKSGSNHSDKMFPNSLKKTDGYFDSLRN